MQLQCHAATVQCQCSCLPHLENDAVEYTLVLNTFLLHSTASTPQLCSTSSNPMSPNFEGIMHGQHMHSQYIQSFCCMSPKGSA